MRRVFLALFVVFAVLSMVLVAEAGKKGKNKENPKPHHPPQNDHKPGKQKDTAPAKNNKERKKESKNKQNQKNELGIKDSVLLRTKKGRNGSKKSDKPKPFVHPGILVTKKQLRFVQAKIASGAQPWANALAAMQLDRFGPQYSDLTYIPHASQLSNAIVFCGPYNDPDLGCSWERDDSFSAYTHALLFALNGNAAHALKAIEILNDWSLIMKTPSQHGGPNMKLVAAWNANMFARAAEIIRYMAPTLWSSDYINRFENMLLKAYLPIFIQGGEGMVGNWELAIAEAIVNIGVFTDNQKVYEKGVAIWLRRVPRYIYLKSDGKKPINYAKTSSKWNGQKVFFNGLSEETCRDLDHTALGLSSALNIAETTRIQGLTHYKDFAKRFVAAMEFHSSLLNSGLFSPTPGTYMVGPTRSDLCAGSLNYGPKVWTYELGFNLYNQRLGMSMPNTAALLKTFSPTGVNSWNPVNAAWESLTHAYTGKST